MVRSGGRSFASPLTWILIEAPLRKVVSYKNIAEEEGGCRPAPTENREEEFCQ